MAALIASRDQVGIRRTGVTATVPDHPKAKLMYYLSCVANVLQLDNLEHLTNYRKYKKLSGEDKKTLLTYIALFSSDELIGKVFFPSDQLCGNRQNEFFELSAVSHLFAVTGTVLIGGQRKRVAKIMTFKRSWMKDNYLDPIEHYWYTLSKINRKLRA